jgi:hypothetical protein
MIIALKIACGEEAVLRRIYLKSRPARAGDRL